LGVGGELVDEGDEGGGVVAPGGLPVVVEAYEGVGGAAADVEDELVDLGGFKFEGQALALAGGDDGGVDGTGRQAVDGAFGFELIGPDDVA